LASVLESQRQIEGAMLLAHVDGRAAQGPLILPTAPDVLNELQRQVDALTSKVRDLEAAAAASRTAAATNALVLLGINRLDRSLVDLRIQLLKSPHAGWWRGFSLLEIAEFALFRPDLTYLTEIHETRVIVDRIAERIPGFCPPGGCASGIPRTCRSNLLIGQLRFETDYQRVDPDQTSQQKDVPPLVWGYQIGDHSRDRLVRGVLNLWIHLLNYENSKHRGRGYALAVGYADTEGDVRRNLWLSKERARNAVSALQTLAPALAKIRFEAIGAGEGSAAMTSYPGRDESNRRVEIYYCPDDES